MLFFFFLFLYILYLYYKYIVEKKNKGDNVIRQQHKMMSWVWCNFYVQWFVPDLDSLPSLKPAYHNIRMKNEQSI